LDQSEQWREAAFAAKPVTDAANALFPTVYDFYAVSEEADHRRFATNIELTLEVADGRPVILYTWARYHPSNPDLGRRLIPELEYHNHVGRLMAVEHEGVRPHGAVAWGPDYAWLERAFTRNPDGSWTYQDPFSELLRSIFLAEMPEDLTPDDWQLYADRLAIDTFLRIFDALDGR